MGFCDTHYSIITQGVLSNSFRGINEKIAFLQIPLWLYQIPPMLWKRHSIYINRVGKMEYLSLIKFRFSFIAVIVLLYSAVWCW